jgi:hypothetical protein
VVKGKPIIFSAPMIRALLGGRKTQTRRAIHPQPIQNEAGLWVHPPRRVERVVKKWGGACQTDEDGLILHLRMKGLPYAPGDRLWTREAWAPLDACSHSDPGAQALADRGFYRADHQVDCGDVSRWRSPIHMPRWASRLTLTVTDVRVQRLQDISEADAVAEGATSRPSCAGFMSREAGWSMDWSRVGELSAYALRPPGGSAKAPLKETDIALDSPRWAFASYWTDLHGPDAWAANPWVCALTFTVHRCNIDQMGADA